MVLDPAVLADESRDVIRTALNDSKLVIIRDAMDVGFAERLHCALDRSSAWQVYEGAQNDFHFHHHNIYEPADFPPELTMCRAIFSAGPTKELITDLTGRDCSGELQFGASWYMPGDFSLPHADEGRDRQVAFLWQLTKDWKPEWGGQFYWGPTQELIAPRFNSLCLFTIDPYRTHFVAPVSPSALRKRLTVSGWWTGTSPDFPEAPSRARSRITIV